MAASSSMIRMRCAGSVCDEATDVVISRVPSDMRRFPQHREFKKEGSARPNLALYVDFSGVLLNNAVGHSKSKASAAPLPLFGSSLRGEKRIIDALQVFWRNA